jgi:hypothetical protein
LGLAHTLAGKAIGNELGKITQGKVRVEASEFVGIQLIQRIQSKDLNLRSWTATDRMHRFPPARFPCPERGGKDRPAVQPHEHGPTVGSNGRNFGARPRKNATGRDPVGSDIPAQTSCCGPACLKSDEHLDLALLDSNVRYTAVCAPKHRISFLLPLTPWLLTFN